jgi:hypothetical protein
MIRLKLTDQEIEDIKEALDDPATSDKHKIKLLVIRMHSMAISFVKVGCLWL